MWQHFSFRTRLVTAFIIVLIPPLIVSSWYLQRIAHRQLVDEAQHDAAGSLDIIAAALESGQGPKSVEGLDAWLKNAGARLDNVRLSYLTLDGRVLADSRVPRESLHVLDDFGQLPEVATIGGGGRGNGVSFSTDTEAGEVGAAKRVIPQGPVPMGILRLSLSVAAMQERQQQLAGGVLFSTVVTLLLAAVLSMLLARQLSKQISGMSQVAEAIGRGDYAKRLWQVPGREFSPLATSINKMAENIQAQIQTITLQKEQLLAILHNMKEGVMLLDADGKIRAVNRALTQIFPGIERSQGKSPLEAVLEPELQHQCEQALAQAGDADAAPAMLLLEPRKGLVYDVGIVPLREHEAGLGAVVVFHDISKLKQLERIRRDFVANVSHELRTPLTSIKGYAETLHGDERIDPKARLFLEIIHKNANHMAKIVEDLLSLSRLEAEQQDFETGVVDASSALMSAFRECEPLGRNRRVGLDNRLPPKSLWVVADYDRLVQVFRNLIENAFRYSPEGDAVTVRHERSNGEVVFGVSDHGPGIPREEQAKIFERFYRIEKHRMKTGGSSGLGLAIAKHIVERHGGRIWVESPARGQETGATFFFTIPAAPDHVDERTARKL